MKSYFLFFLLFFFVVIVYAQQTVSIHLTEKDGLPDIEFYDIAEDSKGFIWLAADKGLYRYDGKDFKLFTNTEKKGRSLFGITFDENGRLWCNNIAGQFFYIENEKLILFKEIETNESYVNFVIAKNHLIINNNAEVLSVDIKNKASKIISKNSNSGNYLNDLKTSKDSFFIIDNYKLYKSNDATFSKKKQVFLFEEIDLKVKGYVKFFKLNNTIFFFKEFASTQNKLVLYKIEKGKKISIKIPEKLSRTLVRHTYQINNEVWTLTNKGVYVAEIKNNVYHLKKILFPDNFITDVLVDSNNNYWFTTINDGVFVVPNQELKTYTHIYKNNKTDISDIAIIDSTSIFVATRNGKISKITSGKTETIPIKKSNEVFNISYNKLSNSLLISSRELNSIYNFKNKIQKPIYRFYSKSINVINENKFLISEPFCASIYNTKKDSVFIIREKRSYQSIYEKSKNKAFISYIDGFKIHNLNNNSVRNVLFKNKPILGSLIASNNNDLICIATHNNGVICFKNEEYLFSFNKSNGLLSNLINAIELDKNTIWIATDKGIQSYNYLSKKRHIITKQDGLTSTKINTLKVNNDIVYFGSDMGLFSFNSNKISKTRNKVKPYFTDVYIEEEKTILTKEYYLKEQLSSVKIVFNTNGFQSKEFIEYQYQLKGFNNKWVSIEENTNFVKFNSLPDGKFIFNLRAKNKYSSTFSKPISIYLNVSLPFYKTWYFFLLCLCLIGFLIWLFFNYKTKRLKREQKLALEKANISKELIYSQLENLRSQMNPHFIFNALNSIQDYIIMNEKKLARTYLVKFSRLIRTYLEQSQKNTVSIGEEISTLQLYLELEKDRFDDDFNFNISIDKDLDLEHIFIPSLFLQPYIENAVKHGLLHKKENKKLDLEFIKIQEKNTIRCIITDNGIGREASNKIKNKSVINYKSFATNANQKRVNLLNTNNKDYINVTIEDLVNINKESLGTKIIIDISLK